MTFAIIAITITPMTVIVAIAIAPTTAFAVADVVADVVVDMATAAIMTAMATIIASTGRCPTPLRQSWLSVRPISLPLPPCPK